MLNGIARVPVLVLLVGVLATAAAPARAELVEEIVAWVNGDIITRSDLENEEQMMMAEAYRRYAGDELDRTVQELRRTVLMQMIDRKILVHYASRYDLDRMRESYYESFRSQQQVESDEEFERLLAKEGLTVEEMKDRLIEMFAPEDVVRFEVRGRVSVGDREVEEFYAENPREFTTPGEVTLREIVLLADDRAAKKQRRQEMQQIRERVVGGEEFAAVAGEVSESGTAQKGGLLGPLKAGELADRLNEVAFRLPVGEVSQVIEADYGFHLLKVESRQDPRLAPIDEVRERIRAALEERRFIGELETFLQKARTQADWCIKDKYRDRAPDHARDQRCQSL